MSLIVRRDPFNEFMNIFNTSLPRLFNGDEAVNGSWVPGVDIREGQHSIVLEADLPGVKPEDFKLSIENNRLTLSGERRIEKESNSENFHRVERSYGSFSRTFRLPSTVSVDDARAEFKGGVLRVTLPKREEAKSREIKITVTDATEKK
jgi:HSP20 family protein